ncbi:related to HAT (Half-A-TPR) repeat-containing [Lecanosticta acicola]|uniref:Related to HAT (Half-A-TPR) repeat-containing n=1 Tax=Lecanosticta acicola TaxID=111012 RepID=A0AAI8Z6Y9_9PEZI|nr:related to HAT (Half-A-TPR) repeat-containing [Lecanosticta acicola]
MAATTDRARFYLEQYVPELQEWSQKGIFSREEITSITKKRSDFEHILNARGSTPADYARYATYEMNLDALRKKRSKRLGAKATAFGGQSAQRTVFFVLDRATKKFPGDMGLWMQYISFCKKEKAGKKLGKVFTAVLRLHPRDWGLWILAAKHYAETQGDMGTARSYLQRGLRFNMDEERLWCEYIKLEMVYLAKIAARKKILGLDEKKDEERDKPREDQMDDEDMIALPAVTAEDFEPDAGKGVEEVDEDMLKRLDSVPAFTGGIPMALFDAAMKQFGQNAPEVAESIFDLVASFNHVPATPNILQHILEYLQNAPQAFACEAKRELLNVDSNSPDFPIALGKTLAHLKRGLSKVDEKQRSKLAEKAVLLLLPLAAGTDVGKRVDDADVQKAIEASMKKYAKIWGEAAAKPGKKATGPMALAEKKRKEGLDHEAYIIDRLVSGKRPI